jgi:hypothetical protein
LTPVPVTVVGVCPVPVENQPWPGNKVPPGEMLVRVSASAAPAAKNRAAAIEKAMRDVMEPLILVFEGAQLGA